MKTVTYKSPNTIAIQGFEALVDKLGPGGAIQFINQYETGKGNYSLERKALFKSLTLNELKKSLA